ncbi:uncharacterized protein LOC134253458 [Saccostrea cucullata]|uniref:uncharacterized protein LOC134253458 n=1 Tax=Saccostrea cuccullata TaxID=36930 RepID=UPI002ED06792
MDIGEICLWILSLCALGFFQENENGTYYQGIDTNNTLMNWYEAQNYCQSLNSSLVDPFEYEISVNGSFWTNRHLAKYSSWIYIKGCIDTSSLNFIGRVVSSLGQCDSLCTHTSFFGIQNSTCICLDSDEFVVRKTCNADCLKDFSPLEQCESKTDIMTLYGKFTVLKLAAWDICILPSGSSTSKSQGTRNKLEKEIKVTLPHIL